MKAVSTSGQIAESDSQLRENQGMVAQPYSEAPLEKTDLLLQRQLHKGCSVSTVSTLVDGGACRNPLLVSGTNPDPRRLSPRCFCHQAGRGSASRQEKCSHSELPLQSRHWVLSVDLSTFECRYAAMQVDLGAGNTGIHSGGEVHE